MDALALWKAAIHDQKDCLKDVISLLHETEIRLCLIGDQAVNAYAEPVLTLDFELAVAAQDLPWADSLLYSLNVAARGSDLRVQLQKDPRYSAFVGSSQLRGVLGVTLPVAEVQDVLRGKIWAAQDPSRRSSKRLKDMADIARLLENYPQLGELVPQDILERLF